MANLEACPWQDNPHIPSGDTVGLRAYNLMPGAAFMVIDEPDPRVWIAERVARDSNFEQVYVWAHDGSGHPLADDKNGLSTERAFSLDFNTLVCLVGLVVNPDDRDDNDWGV